MFQYEKMFQDTVPPYFSFGLVFGQISAYVWSKYSLERGKERERERSSKKTKRFLAFLIDNLKLLTIKQITNSL